MIDTTAFLQTTYTLDQFESALETARSKLSLKVMLQLDAPANRSQLSIY